MNVIDTLSEGIANKDWALVENALSLLIGNNLDPLAQPPQTSLAKKAASKRKSKTVTKRINLFEQMKEFEDKIPGYDKINDNVPRTPRKREAYTPKKVVCQTCKANLEVHPTLVREIFTCDKCLTKRK